MVAVSRTRGSPARAERFCKSVRHGRHRGGHHRRADGGRVLLPWLPGDARGDPVVGRLRRILPRSRCGGRRRRLAHHRTRLGRRHRGGGGVRAGGLPLLRGVGADRHDGHRVRPRHQRDGGARRHLVVGHRAQRRGAGRGARLRRPGRRPADGAADGVDGTRGCQHHRVGRHAHVRCGESRRLRLGGHHRGARRRLVVVCDLRRPRHRRDDHPVQRRRARRGRRPRSPAPVADDATTDCELRDDWLLEQDVNAWTSLAYVAAGAVLVGEVRRRRLPPAVYALAAMAIAEGFGSLAYHGADSDVGQFLHDVPLIGVLGFVAGWHVGRLRSVADRGALVGTAIGLVVSSVMWAVTPGAVNIAVAAAVVVIAAGSWQARRLRMTRVWTGPVLVLGVTAIAFWAVGSPGSPACDPDSWLQPHGVWHVLTALVALTWADAAYAALDPDRAPRMFRRFADRALGLLTIGLVLAFHRSVDVVGRERMPTDRPVLVVANHGNGFVDPIVVASVLHRLPRFLAKAALWKVVVARPFLALAGVLPVYRTGDGDRATDNRSVFEACHHELAQGATVAIFPEGTTGDRAGLDRVKSGAARIALGALPTAPDVVIQPIGMAFESKVETRSRAVVMFGEPIVVRDHSTHGVDADGAPDRADAAVLTARITQALEEVSPQFDTVDERELLRAAASEERRDATGHADTSFADCEVVARRLAGAPDAARLRVIGAYRDFATRLELLGITARQLRPDRVSLTRLALSALVVFLAGSLLMTVTLIHLPAVVIVVVGAGLV